MQTTIRTKLLPVVLLAGIASGIFSCKKKETGCDAVVTVTDTTGKVVSGALVILSQDSVVNQNTGVKASVHKESTTDGYGQAYFSFDKEAVLNIEASKGSLEGRDYIRLEPGASVEKTVKIK